MSQSSWCTLMSKNTINCNWHRQIDIENMWWIYCSKNWLIPFNPVSSCASCPCKSRCSNSSSLTPCSSLCSSGKLPSASPPPPLTALTASNSSLSHSLTEQFGYPSHTAIILPGFGRSTSSPAPESASSSPWPSSCKTRARTPPTWRKWNWTRWTSQAQSTLDLPLCTAWS